MRPRLSNGLFALLPKDDGSTGAIAASRGDAEILLDTAYASARPRLLGSKLKRDTANRGKLDKRFGAALSAMPPPPKSFMVYFLSGSDDFTEESKSAITSMMDELKRRPSPEVTVIGHTDKVGGDDPNDTLSLQRAGRKQADCNADFIASGPHRLPSDDIASVKPSDTSASHSPGCNACLPGRSRR